MAYPFLFSFVRYGVGEKRYPPAALFPGISQFSCRPSLSTFRDKDERDTMCRER